MSCRGGCIFGSLETSEATSTPFLIYSFVNVLSFTEKLSTQPKYTDLSVLARRMASIEGNDQSSTWGHEDLTGAHSSVQKVNGGSKAEQADLQPGDIILEINGENTADMLNVEAQNKIKNSKARLQLAVER